MKNNLLFSDIGIYLVFESLPCPAPVQLQPLSDRVEDMRRDGQVPQWQEPGSRRARVGGAGQPRRGGQHWLGGAVRLQELVRHQRGSDERRTIMSAIEIVSAFCFWFQKPCWRPRHDFQRYVSVVNASKHRLGCEAPLGTQFRDTGSFQLIVCSTYLCLIIIWVTENLLCLGSD